LFASTRSRIVGAGQADDHATEDSMKSKKRPLRKLHRETLRALSTSEQQGVVGGAIAQTYTVGGQVCCCDSYDFCASVDVCSQGFCTMVGCW
jgi:hypothetical protein